MPDSLVAAYKKIGLINLPLLERHIFRDSVTINNADEGRSPPYCSQNKGLNFIKLHYLVRIRLSNQYNALLSCYTYLYSNFCRLFQSEKWSPTIKE